MGESKMSLEWNSWSGRQQHNALGLELPQSEEEIIAILNRAQTEQKTVRTIGSAHSFVPFWTDDYLVSLDNYRGMVSNNVATGEATFRAGTKLHELGEPLWHLGLSMENMGDIDRQSIAGAISTGTHGTGATFQNIPSQVSRIRMITAAGEVLTLDEANMQEYFQAARVSMGTLGMITEVTLKAVPAYYLHERNWLASIDECAEQRNEMIANNRNWEFFWLPESDRCAMKTLNLTEETRSFKPTKWEEVGPNYNIIPSTRDEKFNEMEFSVPAEAGWECFLEIRQMMKSEFPEVVWPVEYRTLKADNLMISSASGRDTVTISVHQDAAIDPAPLFNAAESIFRAYKGRPHWGKVHSFEASELSKSISGFDRFCEIRQDLDPEGRFLNSFLSNIFGVR
ncbi:MAG: FAD/FMN-containing dehydrogenase [Candidatus Azotimanducaceae bacterium]|jgi:FAD/FMN-containing dehydrogenase